MTIFVIWQLIGTLDSIRNSCDVLLVYANQFSAFLIDHALGQHAQDLNQQESLAEVNVSISLIAHLNWFAFCILGDFSGFDDLGDICGHDNPNDHDHEDRDHLHDYHNGSDHFDVYDDNDDHEDHDDYEDHVHLHDDHVDHDDDDNHDNFN